MLSLSADPGPLRAIPARRLPVTLVMIALSILVLVAAACGGSSDDESVAAAATAAPAETDTAPEPTDVPETPTDVPAEPTEVPAEVEAEPDPDVAAYVPSATDDPALVDAGAALFSNCASCHGDDGLGTGRGRPLTGIAAEEPDRAVHFESIVSGKGRMPAFGEKLTSDEIEAVLSYVRLTFVAGGATGDDTGAEDAEGAEGAGAAGAVGADVDPVVLEMGAAVWGPSCARCHGDNGEGTNLGKPLIGIALEQPDEALHIEVVTNGEGRMPAFGENLTTEEIAAVVAYLRATF